MSATDPRRQKASSNAPGMPLRGTGWRKMRTAGVWALLCIGLFAADSQIKMFERLYLATRTYEEWQLEEILSLLFCAGIVSLFMLGIKSRQLTREIARREAAERLAHESARHDPLTGLANRRRFREEIKTAIAVSGQTATSCAVLYIDLDGFKPINDTHGHGAGDVLLVEVARRIAQAAPKGATVARLGGDEFGVVLSGVGNSEALLFLAQRLQRDVAKPIEVEARHLVVGATVGIAIFPDDGSDAETLIAAADQAMYQAKRAKRETGGYSRGEISKANAAG